MRKKILVSGPVLTASGYGEQARFALRALRSREDLFDINSVIPSAFRQTDYSLDEINSILQSDFSNWANLNAVDYISNTTFDLANAFTWN